MARALRLHPSSDPDPAVSPSRGRRGRVRLAVLLATCALLGGAAGAGVVVATGGSTRTTTVIERAAGTGSTSRRSSSASRALDPAWLYAGTSAGVVDITVHSSSTDAGPLPFGQDPPSAPGTASGTGFLIDHQGRVLTAAHVVDGATAITVKLQDGTTRTASVLGADDATDVAVIKIDPARLALHPLTLGTSASLGVGDQVAAIGDPFGYDRSLSTGIVSGVDRTIDAPNGFTVAHAIQTDAALNPGNSGGPVLDAQGRVVGIVDQIATDSHSDQGSGVGFAVPIDLVTPALKTLQAGGTVAHAYLGVVSSDSSSQTPGASVSRVTSSGPAAAAGVRPGDVITALNATAIQDANDLVAAVTSHRPGDTIQLTVQRADRTLYLPVTLTTQPTSPSTPR